MRRTSQEEEAFEKAFKERGPSLLSQQQAGNCEVLGISPSTESLSLSLSFPLYLDLSLSLSISLFAHVCMYVDCSTGHGDFVAMWWSSLTKARL